LNVLEAFVRQFSVASQPETILLFHVVSSGGGRHVTERTPPRPLDVLLVEDSPGDIRLTQEAFRKANSSIRLHVVTDGVEAMAFLKREGINAASPRPDLVLLDLNMPRMDGREVLAHIKENDDLKSIPTVILTMSEAETDIERTYRLRTNCYLCKPVHLDDFEALVECINDFWLTRAKLPPQSAATD
jgi:two-component system, chemotaxis family, response regulator Rcp1